MKVTRTVFDIPGMDCPSEEKLIRMALESKSKTLKFEFDLEKRNLVLFHQEPQELLLVALSPLKLGASVQASQETEVEKDFWQKGMEKDESGILRILLLINGAMFLAELTFGFIAESTGLIADSMDMFADAAVYGLSLFAVGRAVARQQQAARISGYLQLLLALGVVFEVARRFFFGSEPESTYMIAIAVLALIANVTCVVLLAKHRDGGAHMKASWIFSTNDVIVNAGVILAGVLVAVTASAWPDLIIGLIIAGIVFRGALQILRLSRLNDET